MVILLALLATSAQSAQTVARHHLQVELFPAEQRLQVLDRITFDKHPGDRIMFQLSPRADKMKVRASDKGANFEFNNNELQIDLGAVPQNRKVQVSIGYTATFDDPAPIRPLNADNPGYGVSATISERGSFLLAGSGWYPRWSGGRSNYELTVVAPRGMLAVTAGQSGGHENRGAKTVSKWEVNDPIRGLSLSVGAYIVRQKKAGSITAATYFFKETDHLSEAYLNATVRYLQM